MQHILASFTLLPLKRSSYTMVMAFSWLSVGHTPFLTKNLYRFSAMMSLSGLLRNFSV
jgi:hypothetical protein